MDLAALLIGFAQIGVALAAFTTIAAVVVQVSETTSENLLAVRLATILMFTVFLIVCAVLPLIVYQAVPDVNRFWKISAMFAATGSLAPAIIGFFFLNPAAVQDSKNSWKQTISVNIFGFAAAGAFIWSVFAQNSAFWYILAIGLLLAACLVMLIGLILSFPVFDVMRKGK